MSYYDVNVSDREGHVFATAPRSVTSEHDLIKIVRLFKKKFPENQGYKISASYREETGTYVDLKKIMKIAGDE